MSVIYCLHCLVTGEKYIGQTSNYRQRMLTHSRGVAHGKKAKLQQSVTQYGWDSFIQGIIEETDSPDDREQHWISEYDTIRTGLNSAQGGGAYPILTGEQHPLYGVGHTDATRTKISVNHANVNGARNPRAREYDIIFTDGRTERTDCLKLWATEHGYVYRSLMNIRRGNRYQTSPHRDILEIIPL